MGQKTGGYRRNVKYGKESDLLSNGYDRYSGFQINPTQIIGWNKGTSERKKGKYGEDLNESGSLLKELEEVRKLYECDSNGLGRKGTKATGYTVYGEYRRNTEVSKRKGAIRREDRNQLEVALERVARKYERKRHTKVERKRNNLKERRTKKGREKVLSDKEERKSVLGYSSKRRKGEQRCEAIALSGILPVTQRRANLIARELERNLNHIEVMRNREALRTHHGMSSQYGMKRLGEVEEKKKETKSESEGVSRKGGYYGRNLTVKGTLEGSRRTLSYVVQRGTVPRGTKRARIRISHEHSKTTYGSLGVRVTYCYGLG